MNKELQIKDQSELGCRWQCEAPVILSPFLELEAKEEEKADYAQTSATESVDDCIYINSLARKKKPVVQPSSHLLKVLAENISLKEKIMYLEKENANLQSRLEREASISTHQRRTITEQNRAYQSLLNTGTGGSNAMITSSDKLKAIETFIFANDLCDDNEPMMTKDIVELIIPLLVNIEDGNKGKRKEFSDAGNGMKRDRVTDQVYMFSP